MLQRTNGPTSFLNRYFIARHITSPGTLYIYKRHASKIMTWVPRGGVGCQGFFRQSATRLIPGPTGCRGEGWVARDSSAQVLPDSSRGPLSPPDWHRRLSNFLLWIEGGLTWPIYIYIYITTIRTINKHNMIGIHKILIHRVHTQINCVGRLLIEYWCED